MNDNSQQKSGTKKVVEKVKKTKKTVKKVKKIGPVVAALAPIILHIMLIMVVLILVFSAIMFVQDKIGVILTGVEKFSNFISFNGWNTNENVFFERLQTEYDRYEAYKYKEDEFDSAIIAATVNYNHIIDPEGFSYTGEQAEFEFDPKNMLVSASQLSNFYEVALDELGYVYTSIGHEKKLLGNLVDVKFKSVCVESSVGELSTYANNLVVDLVKYVYDKNNDEALSYINKRNALKFVKILIAYHDQGKSWLKTQLSDAGFGISDHNSLSDLIRIIDNSDFSNTCGEGEIKMPVITRFINYDLYKKYLRKSYLPNQPYATCRTCEYNNAPDEEREKILTHWITDIFDQRDMYVDLIGKQDKYIQKHVYGYCPGVTVVDKTGSVIDTVDLDEYVAGVISGETYSDTPLEALKAQAIAARTYVLNSTNNCSTSIEASDSAQAYISDYRDDALEATLDTSGLVLIYDDAIFSTMYDSFCYNDGDCPDAIYSNGIYSVQYTKLPKGEKHIIKLTDSNLFGRIVNNGGHAKGMSQLVAAQMAGEGSDYKEILNLFYSDGVEIVNMTTISSSIFAASSEMPSNPTEIHERSKAYAAIGNIELGGQQIDLTNIYRDEGVNIGQCVWYARGRMLELIYTSDMPDKDKAIAFNAVASSRGNGWQWYDNIVNLNIFKHEPDYTLPHAGSFVSWSGGVNKCRYYPTGDPGCGHVAVIESVNYENQTVVISEGWKSPWGTASWSSVQNATITLTFDQIKTKNKGSYYSGLNGYVYVLG